MTETYALDPDMAATLRKNNPQVRLSADSTSPISGLGLGGTRRLPRMRWTPTRPPRCPRTTRRCAWPSGIGQLRCSRNRRRHARHPLQWLLHACSVMLSGNLHSGGAAHMRGVGVKHPSPASYLGNAPCELRRQQARDVGGPCDFDFTACMCHTHHWRTHECMLEKRQVLPQKALSLLRH